MADYNERTLRLAAELKEQALRNLGRLPAKPDRGTDREPGAGERSGKRSA